MSVTIAVTTQEKDACFALREQVFVQEQGVPRELEMDEQDAAATHFLLRDDTTREALGTARLLDKGGGTAKIGRVAVLAHRRGEGRGREMMLAALAEAKQQGFTDAVLDSQTQAVAFYERLGFVSEGGEFLDADIPHFRMRRAL